MGQPEFLTVPELANLLRIKERKVYDLAATGAVPCTRATGKLLFPENEVRAWITKNQTGTKKARPSVFLGSHDPLLEWALRQSECGLATYFDGSSDGLARFAAGEGIAAGLHIPDATGWNISVVKEQCGGQDAVLISWATRQRGLIFRGEMATKVTGIRDLKGLKVATRQPSSGTSILLQRLLNEGNVEQLTASDVYHSEQDAVHAVADGTADVTFGLEVISRPLGLSFLPVARERFDILVDRSAYFEEPFQRFIEFCRSSVFRDRVAVQPGYFFDGLGAVRWNA